jgi:hypothetical protein
VREEEWEEEQEEQGEKEEEEQQEEEEEEEREEQEAVWAPVNSRRPPDGAVGARKPVQGQRSFGGGERPAGGGQAPGAPRPLERLQHRPGGHRPEGGRRAGRGGPVARPRSRADRRVGWRGAASPPDSSASQWS